MGPMTEASSLGKVSCMLLYGEYGGKETVEFFKISLEAVERCLRLSLGRWGAS